MLTLYFAPHSRAIRIVWLLEELRLPYQLERMQLGHPDMRGPDFRKLHPMGRVPVLIDGDVTLYESGAIVEYVLARYGNGALVPKVDAPAFPAYLQWLHYSEGMLMPPVNSYMVETVFLPEERRSEVHAKRAVKLLGQMLRPVDEALDGQEHLAGNMFTAADIMTGSAAITARRIGVDMSGMPRLLAYIDRLSRRPAFQTASTV